MKDQVDDPVDAGHIDEAHHRPGTPAELDEHPLDHIGRPQLPPQVFRKTEEAQQSRQVSLELFDEGRIVGPPLLLKALEGILRRRTVRRQIDGSGVGLQLVVLTASSLLHKTIYVTRSDNPLDLALPAK